MRNVALIGLIVAAAAMAGVACTEMFTRADAQEKASAEPGMLVIRRGFYPSGRIMFERTVKIVNGVDVIHGMSIRYSEDGEVISERTVFEDVQEGRSRGTDLKNSVVVSDRYMRNGLPDGVETQRSSLGVLTSIRHYVRGKLDGTCEAWDEGTGIHSVTEYSAGLRNGPSKSYFSDGTPMESGSYSADLKSGEWVEWYTNGQLASKGSYLAGKSDGPWIMWWRNGNKMREGSYANGNKIGTWKSWTEEGSLSVQTYTEDDG